MLADFQYALRALIRSRRFTAIAFVILALGIGANAAIFSVVNSVLLRPLPFADADRLVLLSTNRPNGPSVALPFSLPAFFDLREQARAFDGLAAWSFGRGNVSAHEPEQVQYVVTTANLFSMLGVAPASGRGFQDADDRAGAPKVAVISHGLSARLGAQHSSITLDGRLYEVIGVLPASFRFLNVTRETDVWLPLGSDPVADRRYARGLHSSAVLARLTPEVRLADAQAETSTIAARLAKTYADDRGRGILVLPLRDQVVGNLRTAVLVLLGAVGLVLLIACANVATLLLARATARRREMAIRVALGASRRQLIRQLLTEYIVLACASGAAGLLIAIWGVALLASLPAASPSLFVPYAIGGAEIRVDRMVVLFTVVLSLATAVIFGLPPALEGSRLNVSEFLGERSPTSSSRLASRTRAGLVVAEIALSAVLLVGAGLLLRTFVHLQNVELGFRPDSLLTFEVSLPPAYAAPRTRAFFDSLLDGLQARGDVTAVGAAEYLPLSGADSSTGVFVGGRPAPEPGEDTQAHYRSVTPQYFNAMGMSLVSGRALADDDGPDAPRVAVINETMARRFWPGENPIGRRVAITIEALRFRPDGPPTLAIEPAMREIVGIVGDVKHKGVQADTFPEVYMPFAQRPARAMAVVVRTAGDPSALVGDARRLVASLDPHQPISRVTTVSDLVAASIAQPRFTVTLLSVFAAIALVLALAGVYAVMSYSVALRTHEIGVRMALGGQPGDIAALLVRGGMQLTAMGLALGLGAALALGRAISGLLFGVKPADPLTLAATAAIVAAVAWTACYVPARRATKIDPLSALRNV